MRFFRGCRYGYPLTAMISESRISKTYNLTVEMLDDNGRKQHVFQHNYKTIEGALKALKTRFPGVKWEETTVKGE